MRLQIGNIGRVGKADIALNGITVIAGENNTGKSTVGKALFAVFNSFYNREEKVLDEIVKTLKNKLKEVFFSSSLQRIFPPKDSKEQKAIDEIVKELFTNTEEYLSDKNHLGDYLLLMVAKTNPKEKRIPLPVDEIIDILKISNEEIFKEILQDQLDIVFSGEVNNIYSNSKKGNIILTIQNKDLMVQIENHKVNYFLGDLDLKVEAIYMDNPLLLDDWIYKGLILDNFSVERSYTEHLVSKIRKKNENSVLEKILTDKKLESLFQKINSVSGGTIVENEGVFMYREENSETPLNIKNLSAGLKSFVIIKELLQNGSLEKNGTLILDEPEVHLHPHWQLLFAEIIVLLHKEFDVHVLINTHSPYFLEAIEVYASRYQIEENCNYYLADNNPSSHGVFTITNVTNETERIYEKLARPLQDLENLRYAND